MKILVTVKRTPQRDVKLRVDAEGRLENASIPFEINPFDELAIEEALRISESRGAEIVVVTIGKEECHEQLLAALAMGADRGVRVEPEGEPDSLQLAKILAAVVRRENPDLVLSGKLAVDDENGQVPAMLAALLDWPQASQASRIELSPDGRMASVTCEVDAGMEHIEVDLPAVVTADLRLNEPRYASLPGIMKARKKPVDTVSLEECGDVGETRVTVRSYRQLPPKAPGRRVDTVEALVEALEEKKLI